MIGWHTGRLAALDFETTGVNVENDRIVTAALIQCGGGEPTHRRAWLLNPGIDIPAQATAVHGITTAVAQAQGIPAREGLEEIAAAVADALGAGCPLVGHKIGGYDLTLLDRELRRYNLPTIEQRAGACGPVLDTLTLDTHVLPYRRRVSNAQGARQLITLAQVYGLGWDAESAHGADYDALMAARIAYRIGQVAHATSDQLPAWAPQERTQRFNDLFGLSLLDLHDRQVGWAAEQAASLQEHLRRTDPSKSVNGVWPVQPYVEQTAIREAS